MTVKRAVIAVSATAAFFVLLHIVLRFIPYPELARYCGRHYGFAVLDRSGRPLRIMPAPDGVRREWASLEHIPRAAVKIFIRAEDRRFYFHPGVDPLAAAAATFRNIRAGRVVSGASTVTMQLARLVRPHGPGLRGKIFEAIDALRLEARLSKKQILELWLNGLPFGSNVEGLPAAGRFFFGREPTDLDDARSALLAVIPRRPNMYNPEREPEAAVQAALALSRRCRLDVSETALTAAVAASGIAKHPFFAPHFSDRAAEIQTAAGETGLRHPLRTTLDLDLQQYAEKLLATEIARLENNRVSNGAVLAVDNVSGAVLAYAGSASWFDDANSGKIDGVQVRNQPGSCLKPFLYALALEKGFLPNDILPDIPSVFGGGEAYSPSNFNRRFNGPVRFRLALASSLNIPAVYLIERLGVRSFEDWLAELGFDSVAAGRGTHGTGLALGNAEISLEELVRAFAVFPRGGRPLNLRFTENQLPAAVNEQPPQIMSPYTAWILTDILSDRGSRFTGFGPAPALKTEFPAMFKTGTANQFQHIWALGATARWTVGVWMGNFSGETVIGRTGSSIPAGIVSALLTALEQNGQNNGVTNTAAFPPVPGGVTSVRICALSGMAAGPACSGKITEWLPDEKQPSPCAWHTGSRIEYPPEYRSWLAERFHRGVTGVSGRGRIRLPVSGSVFYFDPSQPESAQAIRIETSGFAADALVYANDVLQGGLNHSGVFALPLRRGIRRITVEDQNNTTSVDIEVR